MRLLSVSQTRQVEEKAVGLGITEAVLMEGAGKAVADFVVQNLPEGIQKITVLAGPGNNGGDGLVAARWLVNHGLDVEVLMPVPPKSELCKLNANILKKMGVKFSNKINGQAVVDAIFGIGFRGDFPKDLSRLKKQLESKLVFAVDCPSGLNCDTGEWNGLKANYTITFGFPKIGHFLYPGREAVGSLKVVPLFPPAAYKDLCFEFFALDKQEITLPARPAFSHKNMFGHVLVVAGSKGFEGAAALSAAAAYVSGAGLVTLLSTKEAVMIAKTNFPGIMGVSAFDEKLTVESVEIIKKYLKKASVMVIGPGLGRDPQTAQATRQLASVDIPKVVDADAIWALGSSCRNLKNSVITPHIGEASFVFEISKDEVLKKRIQIAKSWKNSSSVLVLKSADTIVVGEKIWINTTGSSALAKGGTGDVLAGMIAAFIAQGLSLEEAAKAAVYIHGKAGEVRPAHTFTPLSLIKRIPEVLNVLL